MTAVWTIMVISFGAGTFAGYDTYLPFKDGRACGNNIESTRKLMEDQGLEVISVRCLSTEIAAPTIRPRTRP